MPVTIQTAPHGANKVTAHYNPAKDADAFFKNDATYRRLASKTIASSFNPADTIYHQDNGFVDTVLRAYNQHHRLTIRPDDVWISVITQLSFYINAHAEDLRTKFVAHEGKKELIVRLGPSTIWDIDYDLMCSKMVELMDENLVDKELKEWILPAFTTTTKADTTVSAIIMMASMKSYFDYTCITMCGIPSVTLDGTKEDWLDIQNRLSKLDEFGESTKLWSTMLKPIISKFIAAFDGEVDGNFWDHIVSPVSRGSGSPTLGGWMTAFCAFNAKGAFIAKPGPVDPGVCQRNWNTDYVEQKYILGGCHYPIIDQVEIPIGSAEVDLKVIEFEVTEYKTVMIAGNMGMKVTTGKGEEGDRVQNEPMWCAFLKAEKPNEEHGYSGYRF
jgi:Domain of unknown function (DUF4419)